VAATVVAGLALTACGVPTDDGAHTVSDADVPFRLLDTTTTSTTRPASTATSLPVRPAEICVVRRRKVVPTIREVRVDAGLGVVVDLMERGPGPDAVRRANLSGGVARVELTRRFAERPGREQLLALAQIVCTLTAQPGVGQVKFTLGKQRVEVLRGDGSLTDGPVTREDYANLIRG
jgi:hypothetical protein